MQNKIIDEKVLRSHPWILQKKKKRKSYFNNSFRIYDYGAGRFEFSPTDGTGNYSILLFSWNNYLLLFWVFLKRKPRKFLLWFWLFVLWSRFVGQFCFFFFFSKGDFLLILKHLCLRSFFGGLLGRKTRCSFVFKLTFVIVEPYQRN